MSEISDYQILLDLHGIKHFTAEEVLFLGDANHNPEHPGYEKNRIPPTKLWNNSIQAIKILDLARERLGVPLIISSGYRCKPYNKLIGGKPKSEHLLFRAFDIESNQASPEEVTDCLKDMRSEKLFFGGIGVYDTFTHLDSRGWNANW